MENPPLTPLVRGLPATAPFVGPETLERRSGRPFDLRLGANESAFGTSPQARQAMREAIEQVAWYNDPEGYELRQALAAHHGVALDQLVLGAGIDELLGVAVRLCVAPGDAVVTSAGSYPTFNFHVVGYGGRLCTVPYRNDRIDLERLADEACAQQARLLYLANPDNPMGTWHAAGELTRLLQQVPEDCAVILDEAYADFAPPEALLPIDGRFANLLRMRTFSKAHGMAGARIGYTLGPAGFIAAFDRVRNHFGVNRIAQAGALASLADRGYVANVVAQVAQGRQEYATLARTCGLTSLPSATNFVAIDTGDADRARRLLDRLAAAGVFVRMPGVAPLDRCIRVTVGTAPQRRDLAALLPDIVKGL